MQRRLRVFLAGPRSKAPLRPARCACPALEPATNYRWRVRASAPFFSPWSEKWSFTTSLDTEAVILKPESPSAGASNVPVKPAFQWTAITGASSYELLVSADADFAHPL